MLKSPMCQLLKECNMLVVGLDNSGKSTILNHFMPEEQKRLDIVPTVGFNVEKFKSRECLLLAYPHLVLHLQLGRALEDRTNNRWQHPFF